MADSTVVLNLESNLAFESQHIVHALQTAGVTKWVCLSEGAGGSLGWLTTNERKEAMCMQLRDCLALGNIFLHRDFFSVLMTEIEAIKIIRDELARYSIITEPAKTVFGKVRKTYTGKLGGMQDDLAICMQLAITGIRCFYQSEKYANFRPTV